MRWKVYLESYTQYFIGWDGEYTLANTSSEAIRIRYSKYDDGRTICGFLQAVPEGWELPLQFNYQQQDFPW